MVEHRDPGDTSGPLRSAMIRNRGVRAAAGKWIAFLDDDNEFEPDHLTSLVTLGEESGLRAVHSWLKMLNCDGTPHITDTDPWRKDPEASRRRWVWAVAKGVRAPGSHVFRDRCDPLDEPDPVRSVDTGEWLLRRDLLIDLPLPVTYPTGGDAIVSEDDRYMEELLRFGEPIGCSARPTLRYYLGGYSNTGTFL